MPTATIPAWNDVAAAFLDDDVLRRDAALHWFEHQWRAPPGADPCAAARGIVAALERFGAAAFTYSHPLRNLPWDAAALDWFIEHGPALAQAPASHQHWLTEVASELSARQLLSHGEALRDACNRGDCSFPEQALRSATKHARRSGAQLWRMAQQWIQQHGSETLLDVAADLLAADAGAGFADQALAILRDPETVNGWDETFAIFYLCRAGVAEAADLIAARVLNPYETPDGALDASERHLPMLPPAAVAAAFLAHDDKSLAECLANFQLEKLRDPAVAARLLEIARGLASGADKSMFFTAALVSLAPEAIAPAAEYLRSLPELDREALGVAEALARAAAFHGATSPEIAAWAEESLRRLESAFARMNMLVPGSLPEVEEMPEGWEPDVPALFRTPVGFDESPTGYLSLAGRNDPCPCGSGKKHKKCCLGKPAPA